MSDFPRNEMSDLDPEIVEALKGHAHSVAVSADLPGRIVERVRRRSRRRRAIALGAPLLVVLASVAAAAAVGTGGNSALTASSAGRVLGKSSAAASGPARSATGRGTSGVEHSAAAPLAGAARKSGSRSAAGRAQDPAANRASSSTPSPAPSAAGSSLELTADGVGAARLGQTETEVVATLEGVLGQPGSPHPLPDGTCGLTSLAWPGLTAVFGAGHLDGYSATGVDLSTARGLHPGDTVATARTLYGSDLQLGEASYRLTTPGGVLGGPLLGGSASAPLTARIGAVDAGTTACPAG